ncbi:MAG TPA: tetratricopeptide repeat protein [Nostocaceae cyanobacterium]|nr:tetratricopeptide repeat protein [Nostocaceae cyanobacterium]
MLIDDSNYSLSEADKEELEKLVNVLELSSGTTIIFAITPESSPQHLVVKKLKEFLVNREENFSFYNFFYSENSFHNFLYSLDNNQDANSRLERKLVMAFGIDQLPTPRLVKEMKRLNLGREEIFNKNLILVFWLNRASFIDEFCHRAPDFWDWRGKVVQFETRHPLLYPYLEWLIAENSYLKTSGVMQVNRQVDIFLDQIYVSLQAQRRQEILNTFESKEIDAITVLKTTDSIKPQRAGFDLNDWDEPYFYETMREKSVSISNTKTITEKVELSEAVRDNTYSVILGAPGAGKTTLLRYLALHFSIAKRDDRETVIAGEAQEDLGRTLLPIFFRIADYAERLKQQLDLTLIEYLRQFYRQWEVYFQAQGEMGTEVAAFLIDAMRQGKCLILLDGLDEVFDQESRRRTVERINHFVDEFPHNKYVITSRIAGYRDVQLSSRFAEYIIEDMSSEKVEQFLYRWCRAVEKAQQPDANEEQLQRRGNEQAESILNAIQENEGVKRLTVNPLLLTILALIHRNGERLPERRVKLYELAVQTLIEDWQLSKKLPDAPKVVLKETEVVELLAPLAYWMHKEKPSGLVTQREVEEQLAIKMSELNDAEPESDSVRQAVGEFLRKVRETTGLFVERSPGVYGFMHLTFEEYFAARYIADNDQSKILELIKQHLHEPRWSEPLLLALGYYGIHFPGQVKKLIERLFSNLQKYQSILQYGEIKIKNSASGDVIICYLQADDELVNNLQEIEFKLQDLLFAGQVLGEIEVNNIVIRKNLIQQLIITCIGVDNDFEGDTIKQLLRTLRKIEMFYQKGEVIAQLREVANDLSISQEMQIKAKTAIIYVTCGQSTGLVDYAIEIVNQLDPSLFDSIRDLVNELGEEMTPSLEISRQYYSCDLTYQTALTFLTAMSYVRKENYDKAIEIFGTLTDKKDIVFSPYAAWSLANCYQEKGDFEQAIDYYQRCFEQLSQYIEPSAFILFWQNRGVCQRLHGKYDKALECFMQMLTISQNINKIQSESLALYHIGKTYQDWNKYEQAINYYEQSRKLDQQLGKDKDVADLWYWMGECYREWEKYQQAIECQNQDLAIRQQMDEQNRIALAYWQLGRIYQGWSKYEQAISYYKQSRELHQQLGKDKDVADLWYWMGECYREWGKYQQAIECQNQDLAIRQQLDDQVNIADAYYQLGRIYEEWDKYAQAITYYEQSRELYQQLGKDENVAIRFRQIADCQILLFKKNTSKTEVAELLNQAEENLKQAIGINTSEKYQKNLAYDYIQLSLLYSGHIYLLDIDKSSIQEKIALFEESYHRGLNYFNELGQTVNRTEEYIKIARIYLEVGVLENLDRSEKITQECLQIFQDYNRRKLIAAAYKLLGEIYIKRKQQNQYNNEENGNNFLAKSLQIYLDLDLQEEAEEIKQLIQQLSQVN